ncbi:hypothetical protein MC885_004713 [Smutsia gigantea]|nr:hypothetical protein MC885_004713 [Smutsia gigantea]
MEGEGMRLYTLEEKEDPCYDHGSECGEREHVIGIFWEITCLRIPFCLPICGTSGRNWITALKKLRTFSTTLPQIDSPGMLFVQTRTGREVLSRVKHFMKQHIVPAEKEVIEFCVQNENSVDKWKKSLVTDKLREMAKAEGLWSLFLPAVSGLNQVDYAFIAEETGKCCFAPDVFNCQAPG